MEGVPEIGVLSHAVAVAANRHDVAVMDEPIGMAAGLSERPPSWALRWDFAFGRHPDRLDRKRQPAFRSHRHPAAVDMDRRSVHVARSAGGEKDDRLGDFFGVGGAAKRNGRDDGREAITHCLCAGSSGRAGRDSVYAHALRAVLGCPCLGQQRHRRLRGAVSREPRHPRTRRPSW